MRSREIWSVIGGGMGYLNWRDATWIPDSFLVLPELQHHSLPTFVSEMTFNETCAKQQCMMLGHSHITIIPIPHVQNLSHRLCPMPHRVIHSGQMVRAETQGQGDCVQVSAHYFSSSFKKFPIHTLNSSQHHLSFFFFFCLGQLELSAATWKQRTLTDTSFS